MKGGDKMLSRKVEIMAAICLLVFPTTATNVSAADTTGQIFTQVDDILKANPLKPAETLQMINIAQDEMISLFIVRMVDGHVVKKHFHKTHDEVIFIIKGTGQMFVNEEWVSFKPGSIHFNPIGKIHSTKQTGNEPLVYISVFTPALKERDRNFVE
jgi:mannose-6-phosphate isomerase-like protein (cupin superfamily)